MSKDLLIFIKKNYKLYNLWKWFLTSFLKRKYKQDICKNVFKININLTPKLVKPISGIGS